MTSSSRRSRPRHRDSRTRVKTQVFLFDPRNCNRGSSAVVTIDWQLREVVLEVEEFNYGEVEEFVLNQLYSQWDANVLPFRDDFHLNFVIRLAGISIPVSFREVFAGDGTGGALRIVLGKPHNPMERKCHRGNDCPT